MSQICVTTEVETWVEDGPDEDYRKGVPYSYRGATGGRVSNVVAFVEGEAHPYYGDSHGKELDALPGDVVYAVVADYSTGDTFGREGGQAKVVDFFLDSDQADRLREVAAHTQDYRFEFEGETYYAPWVGYFEHLNSVEIWACTIRPDRWSDGPRPGYRRGH
jgi:hypothetical protein